MNIKKNLIHIKIKKNTLPFYVHKEARQRYKN